MSNPYLNLRRPAFVPFTVLGDPDIAQSEKIIRTLVESGADALELGIPFSDPIADGPVIQAAATRALKAGVKVDDCFALMTRIRTFTQIPVGLLVYGNLIHARGADKFFADCQTSGVNSVLVADLPLEHAADILPAARSHGIATVFIVSELTSDERMAEICKVAQGYIYVVSYAGVTGDMNALKQDNLAPLLVRIRKHTDLPLYVGFGISDPTQALAAKAAGADGVIVGSRIVKEIPDIGAIGSVCRSFSDVLSPEGRA